MKKTIETNHLKIVLNSWGYTKYIDMDFYYDDEFVTGWCLSPDAVDDLVIKLLKVKKAACGY